MGVKTFLLMAGGTGGHIFPALAVAAALRERGHKVVWLGSEGAMETRIVPQHGIEIETLAIKGVRGNGLKRKLMLPFTLWHTIRAARRIIRKHQVDGAIGFGGFVTVPGGVAAKLCGVPLVIHEQNAVAGLSNRILAKLASRVLYAFPKAFGDENGLVGNPVRADIAALPAPEERFAERSGSLKLLVTGGSLGADILNRLLPEALALLPAEQRPQVRHQSGRGKLEGLRQRYDEAG
ncbi:UDP-N-acetylglucosamine--N-acetylmuramyl-(pentapeptide) pyrophosphoryl-undecaprenol N-acetylglucosamine transferase, partial [Actinomyces oris]|uniref:UDP-N-acetylglucosamine--N-acetylmuramyl- (pentapeptide) pyrophosphoryl-undecaprenol N-acetylglucosamine transferase n=1 Tax=Actinomyces oris TaxID=544580 RepID=UPI0028D6AF50